MKIPEEIQERIASVGGKNRFGEPNFRIVWGRDRIVPIHGRWDDTGTIETRWEPKYHPFDCYHLEMWRPPEDYGTPDTWMRAGVEVGTGWTAYTAGPYPSMGDYELVFPFTSDFTDSGTVIPVDTSVCEMIVKLILASKDLTFWQRKQAIQQREAKKKNDRIEQNVAMMKDRLRPFGGSGWTTVPGSKLVVPSTN